MQTLEDGRELPSALDDLSPLRVSSPPKVGHDCDLTAQPRPAGELRSFDVRTLQVSKGLNNLRCFELSNLPARIPRGTSRAGSTCPSHRANARTCPRNLPLNRSPMTPPISRPFTPLYTTLYYITPFYPTGQPSRCQKDDKYLDFLALVHPKNLGSSPCNEMCKECIS